MKIWIDLVDFIASFNYLGPIHDGWVRALLTMVCVIAVMVQTNGQIFHYLTMLRSQVIGWTEDEHIVEICYDYYYQSSVIPLMTSLSICGEFGQLTA